MLLPNIYLFAIWFSLLFSFIQYFAELILKDFNRSVFIYCALLREYVGYGDKNYENTDVIILNISESMVHKTSASKPGGQKSSKDRKRT